MDIAISDAKGHLTELVRRAEAGEEVILTRHGRPVARLAPLTVQGSPAQRRVLLDEIRASARKHATPGPDAARSQDFLYGADGLPE